jgi:hypothetical protein
MYMLGTTVFFAAMLVYVRGLRHLGGGASHEQSR